MRDSSIGIVILAAGASVRMGEPKQLINIHGLPLICRAAQVALNSKGCPVIVVLGANSESIRPVLEPMDVRIVVNEKWASGMSASIQCGLDALAQDAPDVAGVILMLADQPGVTEHSLNALLHAQAETASDLVAAQYGNALGTPAFFSRRFFPALRELKGQGGAKSLLMQHREEVIPVLLPEAIVDLDTPEDLKQLSANPSSPSTSQTRRQFITTVAVAGTGLAAVPSFVSSINATETLKPMPANIVRKIAVKLTINGSEKNLELDPRVTLLDALRERIGLTGTKKGCDHGQCGACTVLVNGRRINSCLALAVSHDGDEITTIEGLAKGDELHPVQNAFLEHDGFQCGYCTPGQICSAVALLKEGHCNSDAEIREWMSGNICRCGAYPNIVAAIREVHSQTKSAA